PRHRSARVSGGAEPRRAKSCPSVPCAAPLRRMAALPPGGGGEAIDSKFDQTLWPGDFLDQLDLGAVGGFEEADAAAVVGCQLFQDAHAVVAQLGHCPGIMVGVE